MKNVLLIVLILSNLLFFFLTNKKELVLEEPKIEVIEEKAPLPPKINPGVKFRSYPKVKNIVGTGIFKDVLSHSLQNYVNSSRSTTVHELSHFISSDIRNNRKPGHKPFKVSMFHLDNGDVFLTNDSESTNAFYVLEDRAIVFNEPKLTVSDVHRFVPETLRSYRWKTYFLINSPWNNKPLYIFDEWNAYIIGGKCAVEDSENGLNSGSFDAVSGCLEFSIYAVSLCMAIKDLDPGYWEDKNFINFVAWQLNEAEETFKKGVHIKEFNSQSQNELLSKFMGPQGEKTREFMKKEFGRVFFN